MVKIELGAILYFVSSPVPESKSCDNEVKAMIR
jgi:hypothetical protein